MRHPTGHSEDAAAGFGPPRFIAPGDRVIRIERGYVDLFWTELVNAEPSGARRHVMRVAAGGIVFGTALFAAAEQRLFGLLAVGGLACEVEAIPLDQLFRDAAGAASPIDAWLTGLPAVALGRPEASRQTVARPGEVMELARGTLIRAAPRSVAWLAVTRGILASEALGDASVREPGDDPMPVTEILAATVGSPAVVECLDTASALVRMAPRIRYQIDLFNAAMLEQLATHFAVEDVVLIERRAAGRRAAEQALLADLSLLARAAGSRTAAAPSAVAAAAEDGATAAARLVAAALGTELPVHPGRGSAAKTPMERVTEIAAAANIRCRRIVLRGRWWRGDHGPLVGFRGDAQSPVALLVKSPGRYRLVDPNDGTNMAVDAVSQGQLSAEAVCFYRPLPAGPITLGKLFAFAAFGTARDRASLILGSLAIGLMALVVPLATGLVFDTIVPNAEQSLLLEIVGGLVAVALGSAMFDTVRRLALVRMEGRIEWALQSAIVDRLLCLPASFFKGYSSGDLADRLLGIDSLRQILTGTAVTSVVAVLFSLLNFIVLVALDASLALVAAGLVLFAIAVTLVLSTAQLRHQRVRVERRGKLNGLLNQFIIGVNKLRIAGREGGAAGRWARDAARLTSEVIAARRYEALLQVVTETFPVVATATIFLALVILVPNAAAPLGSFSLGNFLAFNASFGQLLAALSSLALGLTQALVAVPLYERARPILTVPPEARPPSSGTAWLKGEIDIQRVTFRYGTNEPAVLEDVSLTIAPGEFVALVGASGSGKSTMLRLVLGFEKPESGTLLFDGRPIESLDLAALRAEMGVVLQHARLTPGSLYENIVGHSGLGIDDAWHTARLVGLAADIEAMPMGMHTLVMEGAQTLSGGQRQRLMIARALVRRPRILLLDEATSALDNRTQATVSESLAQLNVTRLVVAHRLSTVQRADRLVVLERGRIVETGTFAELVARDGAFATLARRQML